MLKYAVYPGYVISKNDGDRHYISAQQLMRLYKVDPRECIVVREQKIWFGIQDLILLKPRYDGEYTIK